MPLDLPGLQAGIAEDLKSIRDTMTEDSLSDDVITEFANMLAIRIDTYVRTGLVETEGTASAQVGRIV